MQNNLVRCSTGAALVSAIQPLLDALGPYREDEALQRISRLRAEGFAPELISAAMTQSRLRTAAVAPAQDELVATAAGSAAGVLRAVALVVGATGPCAGCGCCCGWAKGAEGCCAWDAAGAGAWA